MRTVIVPNYVADAINKALDKAIAEEPNAAKDREELYQQLLNFFDENGYVPDFSLLKKA